MSAPRGGHPAEKDVLTDAEWEQLADAFVSANRAEFMDCTADGEVNPDDPDLPILRAIERIIREREASAERRTWGIAAGQFMQRGLDEAARIAFDTAEALGATRDLPPGSGDAS